MAYLALLLLVSTVMVAGQTIDNPIFPVEACGNRTACTSAKYMEQSHEFCKDYAERVAVPSKVCLNGVIMCDNYSRTGACFSPPSNLLTNCNYAIANCFSYLNDEVAVESTTDVVTTTTNQSTSDSPQVGDRCTSAGKRTASIKSCVRYLECSGEYYIERACNDGYIFYEPFGFCLPGDVNRCQLYTL
uniref:Chitin-binding type-2 domain-containing protein n=1 Tax=Anopheles minimus TaxID=112268 RepID=A0A182WPT9_9DIPT